MEPTARVSRRAACRAAFGSGAALVFGSALAACAHTAGKPGPTIAVPLTTVTLTPWRWTFSKTAQAVMVDTLDKFTATHPGLRVLANNSSPAGGKSVPYILAGTAGDVFTDNDYGIYLEKDLLLPLDSYIQQNNIDRSIWSKSMMLTLQTPSGTFGLPAYYNTEVYAANQSLTAAVGVADPSTDWTYEEFLKFGASLTNKGKNIYGIGLDWQSNVYDWLLRGFGGETVDAAGTGCLLGSSGSIAAGEWVYDKVYWPGIGRPASLGEFTKGGVGLVGLTTAQLIKLVLGMSRSMNFGFYPPPLFPDGRSTFGGDQFYAINAGTKVADAAWELLNWLTTERTWQEMVMHVFLASPGLNSLWEEWQTIVEQVAPVLKGRGLEWFADAAQQGYAYTFPYFKYDDPTAKGLISAALGRLQSGERTSVKTVFTSVAQQIDALETTAAGMVRPSPKA